MFSDNDLDAIRRVGVGSKGMDESKLGRFGRGALTMYVYLLCVAGSLIFILAGITGQAPLRLYQANTT